MTGPRSFSTFDVPLAGTTMVEASAGTGKTWTITALYLRLVAEAGLPPDKILAVTYTEAATAQLRDKVRTRLREAWEALERGASADPFLGEFIARLPDREAARERIGKALHGFDGAALHTIHAFCQRLLGEIAFECGVPFEPRILPDEADLLREVTDDFWRRRSQGWDAYVLEYLRERKVTPDTLRAAVTPFVHREYLAELNPPAVAPVLTEPEKAFEKAAQTARRVWRETDRSAFQELLVGDPNLDHRSYSKRYVPGWLDKAAALLSPDDPPARLLRLLLDDEVRNTLSRLGSAGVMEKTKPGKTPPSHPVFTVVDELLAAHDALATSLETGLVSLRRELIGELRKELPARKERLRVMAFDDLLLRLKQALEGPAGPAALAAARDRYRAALIDEFQDTDPVQWDIFRNIFQEGRLPLILVGDPKQAIYRFRGADVFTYLKARETAGKPASLDVNRRSTPRFLEAVNTLFQGEKPFLLDRIGYPAAQSLEPFPALLEGEGADASPLRFWHLLPGKTDKESMQRLAAQATAEEIVRLLGVGLRIRETAPGVRGEESYRPLEGGDIAVLVRTGSQGARVRRALAERKISSVQRSDESVFCTREAGELQGVLAALADPGDDGLLRGALATELLGWEGAALEALREDDRKWAMVVEQFREYRRIWAQKGFMPMFRCLVRERHGSRDAAMGLGETITSRLLSRVDGERRLTNLFHLAELLHAAAHVEKLGPEGLHLWLARKRTEQGLPADAALMRLESDENLVKIVTVHGSKGLEYPIVFVPFAWWARGEQKRDADLVIHDPPAHAPRLVMGAAPDSPEARRAMFEDLADELRLLYVAVTRARFRCYLAWGAAGDAERSPLAWLLFRQPGDERVLEAFGQRVKGLREDDVRSVLESLTTASPGALAVEDRSDAGTTLFNPAEASGDQARAREFKRGELHPSWQVTSYSRLTTGHGEEQSDHDAVAARQPDAGDDILPAGAEFGTCVHEILQHFDPAKPEDLGDLTRESLGRNGLDRERAPRVLGLLDRTLRTPLESGGPRLLDIPVAKRLTELKFWFPLKELSAQQLISRLGKQPGLPETFRRRLPGLSFKEVHGFMNGSIDLAFEHRGKWHLLDYKSNRLGFGPDDYAPERLEEAMAHSFYFLQYLIYTVALHRYLGLRLPGYNYDTHLGGVYYLFLRGMDPGVPGSGVFRHRPPRDLVEALDALLGGTA